MPSLLMMITDAGLDALVDAENAVTGPIEIVSVGLTDTPFVMAPTLTALPGEHKIIDTISGQAVADNIIHVTAYDTSAETYDVTGFGLYLDDGTLFAVYSGAALPILTKAQLAFGLFSFDIAFLNNAAANITFGNAIFSYPPATKTVMGVVELADDEETDDGDDDLKAMTSKMVRRALMSALPTGIITIWSGAVGAVPLGWHLCDGDNGTPDLQDKFVIGAGSGFDVGDSGGSTQHNHGGDVGGHILTTAQMPPHRHLNVIPVASSTVLAGNNSISRQTGSGGDTEYDLKGADGEPSTGQTSQTGGGEAHDHGLTIDSTNHLPPYYALAYIMKFW